MTKKLVKILTPIVLSVALIVGGTVSIAQAANGARACSHDNWIEDNYWVDYVDRGDGVFHEVYEWQERYCMDCGAYYNHRRSYIDYEEHSGWSGGRCGYCGGSIK